MHINPCNNAILRGAHPLQTRETLGATTLPAVIVCLCIPRVCVCVCMYLYRRRPGDSDYLPRAVAKMKRAGIVKFIHDLISNHRVCTITPAYHRHADARVKCHSRDLFRTTCSLSLKCCNLVCLPNGSLAADLSAGFTKEGRLAPPALD